MSFSDPLERSGPTDRRPVAVDAFCGAGGLSLGLMHAGFDLRAAFDWDAPSISTYQKNLGPHGFEADATVVSARDIWDRIDSDELDLFAGGPPCQGFSKQTRGAHSGDSRNALMAQYLRLVTELQPKAFLLENVAMAAQARGRHLVAQFHELDEYRVTGHFYVAADYGVAQTRERFVLVGVRRDVPGGFRIPEPTTPTWPTVGSVIGDLPEPPSDCSEHPKFANHQQTRISDINRVRFSHVPQGGGWQDIPFELRLPCHQKVDVRSGGWPDVYGRLRLDGQCPTITGGFDSFTRGRYGHPLRDRAITPREAARLQGFPDDFVFLGKRDQVRHQIGNAVPVPLAAAIGKAIVAALDGATPILDEAPTLF